MGSTGDKLSTLGYGCMRFPTKNGKIDEKKAEEHIQLAIDKGINYFDTAWPYHSGKSESFLGKVLAKDGLRNKVKIATKLPPWLCKSRNDMEQILDKQLELLKTDHIDYYLLHSLNGEIWKKMQEMEVQIFLDDAVKAGKIINKGFSFHGPREEFKTICDDEEWRFCQIQYNLLDEYNQAGREGLEYAAAKGLGIVVMEPLRGGSLAEKLPVKIQKLYDNSRHNRSNAEWALRWIWDHKEVAVILSGMNHENQVLENIETATTAFSGSLTDIEKEILNKVGEQYQKLLKIGCTGCQYCIPCPAGVDIPRSFGFYNDRYMFRDKITPWAMYILQLGQKNKGFSALASLCVNCGKCVKHCPQSIDIPEELKKVKRKFEGPASYLIRFIINKILVMDKGMEK
ncbi:MAG: aldo/keto reductase [Deltaproteobacteria bacterium]|nr:aldo/keto reductase [Deltaproteobacteria bacterium]